MRNVKKYIFLLLALVVVYFSGKFINYNNAINDVIILESSRFRKYLKIYDLTKSNPPKGVNEIKDYIKEKDSLLYEKIKDIDFQYIKNNDYGNIYLKGFDKNNDSLKKTYRLSNVNFFSSINIKGDVELDLSYSFPIRANGVYRVESDTINYVGKTNIISYYVKFLKCTSGLKLKNLDYHKKHYIKIKIYNGKITYEDNDISKLSLRVIDSGLKKSKYFLDKESLYLITLKTDDISVYECFD